MLGLGTWDEMTKLNWVRSPQSLGRPALPSTVVVYPWAHFLAPLGLQFIICEMGSLTA